MATKMSPENVIQNARNAQLVEQSNFTKGIRPEEIARTANLIGWTYEKMLDYAKKLDGPNRMIAANLFKNEAARQNGGQKEESLLQLISTDKVCLERPSPAIFPQSDGTLAGSKDPVSGLKSFDGRCVVGNNRFLAALKNSHGNGGSQTSSEVELFALYADWIYSTFVPQFDREIFLLVVREEKEGHLSELLVKRFEGRSLPKGVEIHATSFKNCRPLLQKRFG